jgi:DNA-binding MarR family transcriptional regulator
MPARSDDSQSVVDPAKCLEMANSCASFTFRKAARAVTQMYDQILAPIGLRSTQLVILVAAQAQGPCRFAVLAKGLVKDRSTLTRNLQPLLTQGLLRVTGKSGRAGKSVEITPAGQRLLAQAVPYWEEAQKRLLEFLGQERWDRMMCDLTEMVDIVRPEAEVS